jgi:hypothetical protein
MIALTAHCARFPLIPKTRRLPGTLLAFALALSVVACGSPKPDETATSQPAGQPAGQPAQQSAADAGEGDDPAPKAPAKPIKPPTVTGKFTPPHAPLPDAATVASDALALPYRNLAAAVHERRLNDAEALAQDIATANPTYYYIGYYVFALNSVLYGRKAENRDEFWPVTAVADGYYHLFLLDRLAYGNDGRFDGEATAALTRALEIGGANPENDLTYLKAAMARLLWVTEGAKAAEPFGSAAVAEAKKKPAYNTALVDYIDAADSKEAARAEYIAQTNTKPVDSYNVSPIALAQGLVGDSADIARYKRYALMSGIEVRIIFMNNVKRFKALRDDLEAYLREIGELRGKPDELSAFLEMARPNVAEFEALARDLLTQLNQLKDLLATMNPDEVPPTFTQVAGWHSDVERLYAQVRLILKTFDVMQERLADEKGRAL